jgi:hypothetical protein
MSFRIEAGFDVSGSLLYQNKNETVSLKHTYNRHTFCNQVVRTILGCQVNRRPLCRP